MDADLVEAASGDRGEVSSWLIVMAGLALAAALAVPALHAVITTLTEEVAEAANVTIVVGGDGFAVVEPGDQPPSSASEAQLQTPQPDDAGPSCEATSTCQTTTPCAPPTGCGETPASTTSTTSAEVAETGWLIEVFATGSPIPPPTSGPIDWYASTFAPDWIREPNDPTLYFDCDEWGQWAGCAANIPVSVADGSIGSLVVTFGCVLGLGCDDFVDRQHAVVDLGSCLLTPPGEPPAEGCERAIDAIIESCNGPGFITCAGDTAVGTVITRWNTRAPKPDFPNVRSVPDPAPQLRASGAPDRTSAVYIAVRDPDGTVTVVGSRPGGMHAEDVAQALVPGGQMSRPFAWRRDLDTGELVWGPINVCTKCQQYSQDLFPPLTPFDEGGAWGG